MRLRSFGTFPKLVTDSFSKSSEYCEPGTVLGTEDTLVNEDALLSPLGELPLQMGEWKAGGKQAINLKKKKESKRK